MAKSTHSSTQPLPAVHGDDARADFAVLRVTGRSLIHFQRNRYSVPYEWVNAVVSLRSYPDVLRVVGPHGQMVDLPRCQERDRTIYDWTHYIGLLRKKPAALKSAAPFKTMPQALKERVESLLRAQGVRCEDALRILSQSNNPTF